MVRYAALALGLVAAIAVAVGIIVVATTSGDSLVLDLDVGDCFDVEIDAGADEVGVVPEVDCDDPHEAEIVAAGELDPDGTSERPVDDVLFAQVDAACAAALADRPDVLERFGILPVVADARSWDAYDGRYVCVAIPYGGGTTTGSAMAGGDGG